MVPAVLQTPMKDLCVPYTRKFLLGLNFSWKSAFRAVIIVPSTTVSTGSGTNDAPHLLTWELVSSSLVMRTAWGLVKQFSWDLQQSPRILGIQCWWGRFKHYLSRKPSKNDKSPSVVYLVLEKSGFLGPE